MERIEPGEFVCPTCGRNFFPYSECEKLMCVNRLATGDRTLFYKGTGARRIKCRLGSYGETVLIYVPPYDTITHLLDTIFSRLLAKKQPLPLDSKILFLLKDQVIEPGPTRSWNIHRFAIRDGDMIVARVVDAFSAEEIIWNPVHKTWMTPEMCTSAGL